MDEIYDVMRLGAFLCGIYFVIAGILGCVTGKCKTMVCGCFYALYIIVGIILAFIMAITLLAFSGLNEEMIGELCEDNYSSLPYGIGDELTASGFSFEDINDIMLAPTEVL